MYGVDNSASRSKSAEEQQAKAETDDFMIKYLIWQNNDNLPFPETNSPSMKKFSKRKKKKQAAKTRATMKNMVRRCQILPPVSPH